MSSSCSFHTSQQPSHCEWFLCMRRWSQHKRGCRAAAAGSRGDRRSQCRRAGTESAARGIRRRVWYPRPLIWGGWGRLSTIACQGATQCRVGAVDERNDVSSRQTPRAAIRRSMTGHVHSSFAVAQHLHRRRELPPGGTLWTTSPA